MEPRDCKVRFDGPRGNAELMVPAEVVGRWFAEAQAIMVHRPEPVLVPFAIDHDALKVLVGNLPSNLTHTGKIIALAGYLAAHGKDRFDQMPIKELFEVVGWRRPTGWAREFKNAIDRKCFSLDTTNGLMQLTSLGFDEIANGYPLFRAPAASQKKTVLKGAIQFAVAN